VMEQRCGCDATGIPVAPHHCCGIERPRNPRPRLPAAGLHKVTNPSPTAPACTLHLYSPPFTSCSIWLDEHADADKVSGGTRAEPLAAS